MATQSACPECGADISQHDGAGGPNGCTLTDNGVAQRLHAARRILDNPEPDLRPMIDEALRRGRPGYVSPEEYDNADVPEWTI
jgi:hypothetical protein